MSQTVGLSARSFLTAGVSAAMVGAVALTPVIVSEPATVALPHVAAPQVQLASLGTDIKAFYNAAEPWAAYAAELGTYALGFIPGLWWVAPGIDLAYFSIEPLVQAGVYAFADLVDLNFPQIPIDVSAGINEAATNFINYGIAWIGSLVPLPPLPPFPPVPPFGAASVSAPARAVSRAAAVARAAEAVAAAEPVTEAVTEPVTEAVTAPRSAKASSVRAAVRAESAPAPAASAVEPTANRGSEPTAIGKAAAKSAARSVR